MVHQFRRNAEVFEAPLKDTFLLLNAATGLYHGLNPVAARIWELLADPVDETELVARLVEEFVVTPEACRREVDAFIAELRERGLIVEG